MNLFDTTPIQHINLLPKGGTVNYYGPIMSSQQADYYDDTLFTNIDWKNDEAIIFGKHILTKRKVAWHGDRAFEYNYSNITKRTLPWTKELLELKTLVEQVSNETYNSCLLNLYHNGDEGMSWHSDGEKDLKKDGAIGSMSFGAARKFSLKHKETKHKVAIVLAHGSLLVMKPKQIGYIDCHQQG